MRLIDADAIMEALNIFNDKVNGNEHFLNGIETAKEIIDNAPTIEAEPVRRGKWVKQNDGSLECSACGNIAPYQADYYGYVIEAPIYPRCPWCGARMEMSE